MAVVGAGVLCGEKRLVEGELTGCVEKVDVNPGVAGAGVPNNDVDGAGAVDLAAGNTVVGPQVTLDDAAVAIAPVLVD